MPGSLPLLLLDAAELGSDFFRGGGPSSNKGVAGEIEKKQRDLMRQRGQIEMQLAEIEKFHTELTGQPHKEAALRALSWHKKP